MSEVKMTHGFGNVVRLFAIKRAWLAFAHGAKATMPSADVAAQHERRRAIGPALKDVRAACFLADSVKVQPFDQLQQVILIRRITQTNPQPLRLRLSRRLVVADDSKFARQ